jgi:hypothetical protein
MLFINSSGLTTRPRCLLLASYVSISNSTGIVPVSRFCCKRRSVKLTDLRLYQNRLTGSIPIEVGNLQDLTGLYFHIINDLTGSERARTIGAIIIYRNRTTKKHMLVQQIQMAPIGKNIHPLTQVDFVGRRAVADHSNFLLRFLAVFTPITV